MNTMLQKRIEEAAHQYIQSDTVVPENMQLAFGDFINGAKFALQNQWISVEEALPEISNNYDGVKISHIVLIKCAKGAIARARYMAIEEIPTVMWECIDVGFGVGGDDVTHWMPIP